MLAHAVRCNYPLVSCNLDLTFYCRSRTSLKVSTRSRLHERTFYLMHHNNYHPLSRELVTQKNIVCIRGICAFFLLGTPSRYWQHQGYYRADSSLFTSMFHSKVEKLKLYVQGCTDNIIIIVLSVPR